MAAMPGSDRYDPGSIAPLDRLTWQGAIFAPRPRRAELAGLVPTWPCRRVHVHVVRNEPFELVAAVLGPFLAYAGLEADITYGPYDDSLSDPGAGLPASCDAVIVWMDMERYGTDLAPGQLVGWVAERVSALRPLTEAPVLVANWGSQSERAVSYNTALVGRLGALTGVYICDQGALALELGLGYTDARMSAVSGSRLSDRAILETARAFGLRWLPAVLVAPVKAIVVDLDHTLYRGVLSEEGVDGIELSEDHRALHRELLACRSRGAYLALASKNDAADVDALFAGRADLDLRPEHFSARAVSWSSKADGIASIADELRIGIGSMLFVDDNPAELAEVVARYPVLGVVQATSPATTASILRQYPGLFGFRASGAARRVEDLAAARLREEARAGADEGPGYLASLEMRLDLAVDPPDGAYRLSELSNRTNQFNTALLRLNEVQAAAYIEAADRCAVGVALRDRFSDSGVIGAVFVRRGDQEIVVDEVDISCRALGRGLEQLIVVESLVRALPYLAGTGTDPFACAVRFAFRPGPKNAPARQCLEVLTGGPVPDEGGVAYRLSAQAVDQLRRSVPVAVREVVASLTPPGIGPKLPVQAATGSPDRPERRA